MSYDFYEITRAKTKNGDIVLAPEFLTSRSNDLMIRGGKFYALIDKQTGFWNQNEYRIQEIIDADLEARKAEEKKTLGEDRDNITIFS